MGLASFKHKAQSSPGGVLTLLTTAANGFESVLLGRGLNASLGTTGCWSAFISKIALFDTALSDDEMFDQFAALS